MRDFLLDEWMREGFPLGALEGGSRPMNLGGLGYPEC